MSSRPAHDDVIIVRHQQSAPRWHVSQAQSSGPSLTFTTYKAALDLASRFAATSHVDVWYSKDSGETYGPVVQHRELTHQQSHDPELSS